MHGLANPHDMMDLKGEVEQRRLAPPGHVKKAANEGPTTCQMDLSGALPRAKVSLRRLRALRFMHNTGKEARGIGSKVTCVSSIEPLPMIEENFASAALWVQRPNTGDAGVRSIG